MGSYNTGPFDSDTAQDLLELYSELTVEERLENLRFVFLGGPRHPDGPFEPVDETEVLAGAALIARALPGGSEQVDAIPQMDWDEELSAAALPLPDNELVRLALDTLRKELPPESTWFELWLSEDDQRESRNAVKVVSEVLERHLTDHQ